jgi:hypothetical protein
MIANFVFPPQAPTPRPQKQGDGTASSRDSNSLRASVLDVALELGIGSNSLVADWMFNNAVQEEEEIEVRIYFPRPRPLTDHQPFTGTLVSRTFRVVRIFRFPKFQNFV